MRDLSLEAAKPIDKLCHFNIGILASEVKQVAPRLVCCANISTDPDQVLDHRHATRTARKHQRSAPFLRVKHT